MAETSISISATDLARLQELAGWAGVSVQEALEQAVKDQYDRKFWDAVNAGYAALRADLGNLLDGFDAHVDVRIFEELLELRNRRGASSCRLAHVLGAGILSGKRRDGGQEKKN